MGIGVGIVLLAVGLVLALGVRDSFDAVDLTLIGWILAGVGGIAIVLALVMNKQSTNTTTTVVEKKEPPQGGQA